MPARNSRSYDLNISTVTKDIWSDGVKLGNSNVSRSDIGMVVAFDRNGDYCSSGNASRTIIVVVTMHVLFYKR